jgi:Tfp pilus assembly ATPase PilU
MSLQAENKEYIMKFSIGGFDCIAVCLSNVATQHLSRVLFVENRGDPKQRKERS